MSDAAAGGINPAADGGPLETPLDRDRSTPVRARRGPRASLRIRLIVTFGLVAALVSLTLAGGSYLLVRRSRIAAARHDAISQSRFNLRLAADLLPAEPADADLVRVTGTLARRGGFETVVLFGSTSHQTSSISASSIPSSLGPLVSRGRIGAFEARISGDAYQVVGGRVLPDGPSFYFFYPVSPVEADLATLRTVLLSASGVVVLLSGLVGAVAARGLLRPIRQAGEAARRLESGALSTRVPERGDDELADLARSLNRMAVALEGKIGQLVELEAGHRRFVSDVSHELRTPLTALTASAEAIEHEMHLLSDDGQRMAGLLVEEVRRITRLVEDLMEISRLDAGVAAMSWEPVNLGALTMAALEVRGWGELVDVNVAPEATTFADPRRLDAIVGNLVANALRHGAPPVRIEVGEENGWLVLRVADAGPRIPPEHLPHLFDRFYKADRSRPRSAGSGLGLAIARENARLHGGEIEVSTDGDDTAFTLRLPARSAPPN